MRGERGVAYAKYLREREPTPGLSPLEQTSVDLEHKYKIMGGFQFYWGGARYWTASDEIKPSSGESFWHFRTGEVQGPSDIILTEEQIKSLIGPHAVSGGEEAGALRYGSILPDFPIILDQRAAHERYLTEYKKDPTRFQ